MRVLFSIALCGVFIQTGYSQSSGINTQCQDMCPKILMPVCTMRPDGTAWVFANECLMVNCNCRLERAGIPGFQRSSNCSDMTSMPCPDKMNNTTTSTETITKLTTPESPVTNNSSLKILPTTMIETTTSWGEGSNVTTLTPQTTTVTGNSQTLTASIYVVLISALSATYQFK